jgi:1,4-alpha-glucan branching enzyme
MLTASEYLERCPPDEVVFLPEGSWGEGGSHYIWLNEQTVWAWEAIYRAEMGFLRLLACACDRADLTPYLQQAARELLLLEASDWTFLITTGSARDYAEVRLLDHARRFESVATLVRHLLDGEPPDPALLQVYEESHVRDQAFEGLPLAAWEEGD